MLQCLRERIGREDGRPAGPSPFYQGGASLGRAAARLLLVLLATAACERGSPAPPPAPPEAPAPPGAATPVRIASLVPLATRFALAIGAAPQLVAVDPASARIAGLEHVTTVSLEGALERAPDLLLVAETPEPGHPGVAALLERGGRVVEFAPHDLEDAIALVRDVGGTLVGHDRAARFEAAFSRPLAQVGGASRGQPRPRVVALVGLEPLRIAGGHSFETDLIEIAGGSSATHPGEEHRVAIGADDWAWLAPDLVLVIGPRPASEHDARALRHALPPRAEVAFFDFDPAFWLSDDPAAPARRLRARIEPLTLPQP